MRNLESLAELKKQGKMRIEERRDNFVRQSLLSGGISGSDSAG